MIVIKYIGWKWYKRSDNITSSRRMDIVKAFNANDLHTEIVIKGTVDDPLFRASDVGVILDISNIRMSITDFDESEKRAVSRIKNKWNS